MLASALVRLLITALLLLQFSFQGWAGVIDWLKHKPKVCTSDDHFAIDTSKGPLVVKIRLGITDIYDVSEEKMQFGLQTFFTEYWVDPSLKLEDVQLNISEKLPEHVAKCIWQPDIIFPNCKEATLFDLTIPNTYLKVKPNKHLHRHTRYKMTVSCNMEFYNFPLDIQYCSFQIAFMSTRSDEALLQWVKDKRPPVIFFDAVKPLSFTLKVLEPTVQNHVFQKGVNYTRLFCNFAFARSIKSSLINTYIPSFLVVCLSWISFWLDVAAVPGRVTLGVTALLTLATHIAHAKGSLPSLDYMTAMDIWLFGCLVMVFLSLVEFTVAQAWARKAARCEVAAKENKRPAWRSAVERHMPELIKDNKIRTVTLTHGESEKQEALRKESVNKNNKAPLVSDSNVKIDNALDRFSRFVFPSVMIAFTSVYWAYFTSTADET